MLQAWATPWNSKCQWSEHVWNVLDVVEISGNLWPTTLAVRRLLYSEPGDPPFGKYHTFQGPDGNFQSTLKKEYQGEVSSSSAEAETLAACKFCDDPHVQERARELPPSKKFRKQRQRRADHNAKRKAEYLKEKVLKAKVLEGSVSHGFLTLLHFHLCLPRVAGCLTAWSGSQAPGGELSSLPLGPLGREVVDDRLHRAQTREQPTKIGHKPTRIEQQTAMVYIIPKTEPFWFLNSCFFQKQHGWQGWIRSVGRFWGASITNGFLSTGHAFGHYLQCCGGDLPAKLQESQLLYHMNTGMQKIQNIATGAQCGWIVRRWDSQIYIYAHTAGIILNSSFNSPKSWIDPVHCTFHQGFVW